MLRLHYNGSNSFWYVNVVKKYQFRFKNSEIKPYPLCWGNSLKDFTIYNMKKMGVKVSVEHFSVDYNAVYTNDIVDIYRFSIKETWFEIIFGFIKRNLLLDY